MGLFEKIFKRPGGAGTNVDNSGYWQTLTTYTPTFTSWDGELYESELVRAAIDARARHISKLSITMRGAAKPKLQTRLRHAPNDFQTWGQFLYRLSTILDMQGTAFIVPVIGEYGEVTGMFPVLPSRCEIVKHSGQAWLRYTFNNGLRAAVELDACGIMSKFQYKDDIFGSPNTALTQTMQLMSIQRQGVKEAYKNANTFRFLARVNNFTKPEDLAKERKRFDRENLMNDGGGLLLFPNTYTDIKQVTNQPYTVDRAQLAQIQTNVFDYFGVNEDVLQNKAIGDAWAAFYEGAIEPFAVQFSDVSSRMLFSALERANGSKLFATANRLQYMSNQDKLSVSAEMADRGLMTRNEIREIWNLPPLPDEIGNQLPIRGEYYNLGDDTNDADT